MEIDPRKLDDAIKAVLKVEREHHYGQKAGSQTARRSDLEREIDRVLNALLPVETPRT